MAHQIYTAAISKYVYHFFRPKFILLKAVITLSINLQLLSLLFICWLRVRDHKFKIRVVMKRYRL